MNKILIILSILLSLIHLECRAENESIEQLERRLINASDTARITILNELAKRYSSSDLNRAEELAWQAHSLLEKFTYPTQKAVNYNRLSYIKGSLGKFEEATAYSDTAIQISQIIAENQLLAESFDTRFTLFFLKGDYTLAEEAGEKSNSFASAAGDSGLVAKSYDNLGIIRGIKGEHTEAIDYFMKSLHVYERLQNAEFIGLSLLHIGHTLELAGNLKKAEEYLKMALVQNREAGNKYNEGWSLLNLGVVYSRKNEIDSAVYCYEEALKIAEEINNQRLILTCLDNIGGKYTLKGDFEKANYYLQKAYKLSESSGQNSRTVYIIGNLAENYLFMGQYDSARIFGERQLEIALASDLISEQKVAYYNLAQIYDSLGNHEKAYHSLLKYIAVNDTIFNQQKSEQIESLRESFETANKEQEIENLMAINEKVRYRNISFAGAAISFLILGVLLYYVQNLKVRRNRLLLEKEKELDQLKSRFFANISHEFRTPLTLILGPLDDLISSTELPDSRKKLTVMQRNADRLLDLINQLLDLSKIESGKLSLNISRTDIIPVIKGLAMSFHSIAEQKDISLDLDVHPDVLEMNYDRAKFETILTNLLSNAFKFTDEHGKISVFSTIVKGKEKSSVREYLRIMVADNGQGIPAAEVEFIFDRFYQSDTNQLLQHEGSGIGLALTKELVELHNGSIRAESKMGEGTKITIELPIDMPLQDDQLTISQEYGSEKVLQIHEMVEQLDDDVKSLTGNRPVVLVIEDHEEVRHYIQEILTKDYAIVSARDGEEGISKALEAIPDLIISDVMMPKKDGYEVCSILKNDERTSHIPFVLLTAKSDSEDKITGLSTKADDYVTKPFVPRELLLRIENLIESRKKLREKYSKESVIRPKEMEVTSIDEKFLNKLIDKIEENLSDEKFGVEQLGDELGMSRSQLHRKLTALLGQGPNQFIRTFRLQRAHDLLRQKAATASEISYQVGFGSPSYFTKCFHEQFGYTPSEMPVDK